MRGDPVLITARAAAAALIDEFPEFREEFAGDEGLLHLQFGALATHTNAAIRAGDVAAVRSHLLFVDRIFGQADAYVANAIAVFYLEHIRFEGPSARAAEALLSSRLRRAWSDVSALAGRQRSE